MTDQRLDLFLAADHRAGVARRPEYARGVQDPALCDEAAVGRATAGAQRCILSVAGGRDALAPELFRRAGIDLRHIDETVFAHMGGKAA